MAQEAIMARDIGADWHLPERVLAGLVAESTLAAYTRDWQQFVAFAEYKPDAQALARWRQDMAGQQGLSAATINRRLTAVRSIMAEMQRQGLLTVEEANAYMAVRSVSGLALKHRRRPNNKVEISREQVRALIDAPDPSTLRGLRDRALLATYASSGGRNVEIAGLRMEQIKRAGAEYYIEIIGKEDEEARQAPLAREAYQRILEWREASASPAPYIFLAFNGRGDSRLTDRPLTRAAAWSTVKKYAQEIGLPHLKPHDLRRYVVTQVTDADGLTAAQQVAGHKDIRTTAGYITRSLRLGITNDLI